MTSLLVRLQTFREDAVTGLFTLAGVVLPRAPTALPWSAWPPHAKVVLHAADATLAAATTHPLTAASPPFPLPHTRLPPPPALPGSPAAPMSAAVFGRGATPAPS